MEFSTSLYVLVQCACMSCPSKQALTSTVVLLRDTPLLVTTDTSSLAVVLSSLCIVFSIDCNTQGVSLVGRPDFGSGSIVLCLSKCCLNYLSAGYYSF